MKPGSHLSNLALITMEFLWMKGTLGGLSEPIWWGRITVGTIIVYYLKKGT